MTWTRRYDLIAFLVSIAVGAVWGAPHVAQEGSGTPVGSPISPGCEYLTEIQAAIEIVAAGELKKASKVVNRVKRRGHRPLVDLMHDLLKAYRSYELSQETGRFGALSVRRSLNRAASRTGGVPESDFLAVLETIRRATHSEAGKGAPEPWLRTLQCHVRLLSGTASVPKAMDFGGPSRGFEAPRRVFFLQPQFTTLPRKRVVAPARTIVDQEGCTAAVEVLENVPEGARDAVRRAFRWAVYEPATLDGEPIAVYWNLATTFGWE